MTSCTGCNAPLGWRKYNFQKQWRIQGYFCKDCMEKIGRDFDVHAKITLSKRPCDSCQQEFFFLTTTTCKNKDHNCCHVCKDLDIMESKDASLPPTPSRILIMMTAFASFGILLMIGGFVYVIVVAPQQESSILHVIIGSCMSGAGFMLARRMVKVRKMILGKEKQLLQ